MQRRQTGRHLFCIGVRGKIRRRLFWKIPKSCFLFLRHGISVYRCHLSTFICMQWVRKINHGWRHWVCSQPCLWGHCTDDLFRPIPEDCWGWGRCLIIEIFAGHHDCVSHIIIVTFFRFNSIPFFCGICVQLLWLWNETKTLWRSLNIDRLTTLICLPAVLVYCYVYQCGICTYLWHYPVDLYWQCIHVHLHDPRTMLFSVLDLARAARAYFAEPKSSPEPRHLRIRRQQQQLRTKKNEIQITKNPVYHE